MTDEDVLNFEYLTQGKLACGAMIFQSLCLGVLPLLDAVGALVASLRSSGALRSPSHGAQFTHGLGNEETEAKSSHAAEDGDPLDHLWQLWTLDLLDTSHVRVRRRQRCSALTTIPGEADEGSRLRRQEQP